MGRIDLTSSFLRIAHEAVIKARSAHSDLLRWDAETSELIAHGIPGDDERWLLVVTREEESSRQLHAAVIVAITFSAFTLEAALNNVLREKATTFLRDAVDPLTLVQKLVVSTAILSTRPIKADEHVVERVKRLQKQRNVLAHARPVDVSPEERQSGKWRKREHTVDKAEMALDTCLMALMRLDTAVPGVISDILFDHEERQPLEFDMYEAARVGDVVKVREALKKLNEQGKERRH